jgi:hypothetical protein
LGHSRDKIVYGILLRRPERKRPLEILRCKLEDNIKMDLK